MGAASLTDIMIVLARKAAPATILPIVITARFRWTTSWRCAGAWGARHPELPGRASAEREALRAFTRRSAGADVSLVFYAGHGIEMDGVNYLVPVDARLERDVDVRFETVTVDDLLSLDVGRVVAAGDPGRVPEQPAGALDAAHGGVPQRQRRQLR